MTFAILDRTLPKRCQNMFLLAMFAIVVAFAQTATAQFSYHLSDQLLSSQLESPASDLDWSERLSSTEGNFAVFMGTDGSKQPQDFGANANLGLNAAASYATSLHRGFGIGYQIGTRVAFNANAVQVFELLGESKDRVQVFSTLGIFQRMPNGFAWGASYDFLSQESFDQFRLGQWRVRATFDVGARTEVGATLNLAAGNATGQFNDVPVELEPVEQIQIFVRSHWQTGAITTFWFGVADEHSEENIVTGTLPPKNNQAVFGADLFAPLNNWLAIYGETNLVLPVDTGAVDAFVGIEFAPRGIRRHRSRTNRFREYLPVASSTSFTTNLTRR